MHALRLLGLVLAFGASALATSPAWAAGYEIAFTPFLPVRTLLVNYQPMREFLERELKEPVTFVSAPDYRTDNTRIGKREYAFIVAVAHSAYVAQADHGYIPLLRPTILTRPTLVVRRDNPLTGPASLAGGVVAMPDALAIVSMQGMDMLRELGLDPQRDVRIAHNDNHAAAVNFVVAGEAAAAIVSDRALRQMPQAVREQVRQLAVFDKGAVPGIVYLASPTVPAARRERLRQALVKFVHTAEGRLLMERLGYGGLVPITARELKALERWGVRLRASLSS